MKFQLLFCIVLALVATFIATGIEAAPSKEQGKHRHRLFKASDIKLLTENVRTFLQNGKGYENKKISPELIKNVRAIENPGLLKLVNYLTWLSDLVLEDYIYDVLILGLEPLTAFYYLEDYLYDALASVGVDVYQLTQEYYDGMEADFYGFIAESDVFWKSWVDEPDRIRENLLIFIPQIHEYLRSYGTDTFNYFQNLVNLSHALLTSDAYDDLMAEVQGALDTAAKAYDDLKAALGPPSEIVSPPTNLTLDTFLGLLPYVAELNVSCIILDGLSTAKQVHDIRRTFDADLVAILGEASVDGADLAAEGRNITGNFEYAVDIRHALNRLALDNLIYAYFYGKGWDALSALGDLIYSYSDGLEQIPPLSVEVILQLVALVDTAAPEYQQSASELVTKALQDTDSAIKTYLEVYKPKENKH